MHANKYKKYVKQSADPTKNSDTAQRHLGWYDSATRYQREHKFGTNMRRRALQQYIGRHFGGAVENGNLFSSLFQDFKVAVNLTMPTVESHMSFLVSREAKFDAEFILETDDPQLQSIYERASKALARAFNLAWENVRAHRQFRKAVKDVIIQGLGHVHTGWKDTTARTAAGDNLEYDSFSAQGEPIVRRVKPGMLLWDFNSADGTIDTSRWAIEIILSKKSDILERDFQGEVAKKVLDDVRRGVERPTTLSSFRADNEWASDLAKYEGREFDEAGDDDTYVLFAVWDQKFKTYSLYLHGVKRPIMHTIHPYFDYLGRLPFRAVTLLEVPDEPFSPGVPATMESHQKELNHLRASMFARRRKGPKYVINGGIVKDASERNKILSAREELLVVNSPVGNMEDIVGRVDDPKIDQDSLLVESRIEKDIEKMFGLDALSAGNSLPSRTSATEVNTRVAFTGSKMQSKKTAIDEFGSDIARDAFKHFLKNFSSKQFERVLGITEAELLERIPIQVSDIRNDLVLKVTPTSETPNNPDQDKQMRLQAMSIVMNALTAILENGDQVDVGGLVRWALQKFDDDAANFIIPGQRPQPQLPGGQQVQGTAAPPSTPTAQLQQTAAQPGANGFIPQ